MENTYSPKQFGQVIGKSVLTLQRWDRAGLLKAHRTPTNRRYYTYDQYLEYRGLKAKGAGQTIVDARVSSQSQKPDLPHQLAALRAYCQAKDWQRWMSGWKRLAAASTLSASNSTASRKRLNWGACSD